MQQPAATRPPSFPQRLYRAVERIGEKGIHVGRYVYDWFVFLGGVVFSRKPICERKLALPAGGRQG